LKHYYPAEFLCALLNNQPMGFYSPAVLANEAKRRGVRTIHPSINESQARNTVAAQKAVRLGLAQVRGLGTDVGKDIVAQREAHGAYRSIPDLARRVYLGREALESLALVGAFDEFGLSRREAIWQAGLLIPARKFGPRRAGVKDRGHQLSLPVPVEQDMVTPEPMTAWERSREEYRGLGLSPLWHPLGLLRSGLPEDWVRSIDLEGLRHGTPVTLVGLVVCRQRPETAKGITFLLLEDEVGLVNVIVSPAIYEQHRHLVRSVPFLVVGGRLEKQHGTINVVAHTVSAMPLPDVDGNITQEGEVVEELPMPRARSYR
jgi:error-prone DNA polymerase